MTGHEVVLEIHERVAHLVLDAPPRNELSLAAFQELSHICRDTLPGLAVKGMLVYGRGRHFSSGANVDELKRALGGVAGTPDEHFLELNIATFKAIENLPYPVVAAIGGCCYGAGLELALACHYRIAARRAVFALPEVEFGLLPGCGGTVRLQELVEFGAAAQLVLSGHSILADEAHSIGLIDLVVNRKQLILAAEAFILSDNPAS